MDAKTRTAMIERELENIARNLDLAPRDAAEILKGIADKARDLEKKLGPIRKEVYDAITAAAEKKRAHAAYVARAKALLGEAGEPTEPNIRALIADVQSKMVGAKGEELAELKGLERALGSLLPPIKGTLNLS